MDERGLAESRTRAQALIMAGKVRVNGEVVTKAGQAVSEESEITVEGKDHPWVSRGGLKLAHGLKYFNVNPTGMICVDIGASTGGFTDVLLHYGAEKVYAVDVGHGQLDWKLRGDPRVMVMEQTNARYLTEQQIPDTIDLIVCDASFISLKTVLPAVIRLASGECLDGEVSKPSEPSAAPIAQAGSAEQGRNKKLLLALIKPQFEAGREKVGKGGVVRDEKVHLEVCETIRRWLEEDMSWGVLGMTESPITGPSGNKEFLICATRNC